MRRAGKEPGDGMRSNEVEERCFFDGFEHLNLLIRGERREHAGTREEILGLRLKILEPLRVRGLTSLFERHECPVDERLRPLTSELSLLRRASDLDACCESAR